MSDKKTKRKHTASLRRKTATMVFIISILLSVFAVVISIGSYSYMINQHYKDLAYDLAETAASQMSADDIVRYYNEVKKIGTYDDDKYWEDEAYKKEYDKKADALKDEKYQHMLKTLFDFKDNNDIEFIYVQVLDGDMCTYIFDADRADDRCQLGTTHHISSETMDLDDRENGVDAFISNDEYGWLCSCMRPIKDANGKPVALLGVDVNMNEIVHNIMVYVVSLIVFMAAVVALIVILAIRGVNKTLVQPINDLSEATRTFVEDRNEGEKDVSAISKLNIRTGDEVEALSDSIKQMEQDINNYIIHLTRVTAEKERIGAELDVATHIQSSMLPSIFPAFPERPEFEIYASMDPAKEVGGDFYDFFMVDDRHLAIVMADVSGKGVPAALFMVIGKTLIKDHTVPGTDLSSVFSEVNNILCESNSEGLFITAFEGVLDLVTGEFRYVNAGHEPPFIARSGGRFEPFIIKPGFVLAGMEDMMYKSGTTTLAPGDKVFQYTDGVTEATDSNNNLYGMERLEVALNSVKNSETYDILGAVKKDIEVFVGEAPQFDDITMLCVEFKRYMQEGKDNEEN